MLQANFFNEVLKKDELLPKVMEIAKKLANYPPEALMQSKRVRCNSYWIHIQGNYIQLIRSEEQCAKLEAISKNEIDVLVYRWTSRLVHFAFESLIIVLYSEFVEAIMKFMTRKSKL
jgi:hypothetical protein